MSGKHLLDTNILIALFAGDNRVKDCLADSQVVFVPSIVLGELYYGAINSRLSESNLRKIEKFEKDALILSIDFRTARIYGKLKNTLKSKGKPIPENDVWIAACALQHNLTLVSRDAHFESINGLDVEKWY